MSTVQIGVSMALAEVSRAAVGTFDQYEDSVRYSHTELGVSQDALSKDAREGAAFRGFVAESVKLLPPAHLVEAEPNRLDKRIIQPRIAFGIGDFACAYTTDDSVRAQALWESLAWYGHVPHYLIGKRSGSWEGDGYLAALPAFATAPDDIMNKWLDEQYPAPTLVERVTRAARHKANRYILDKLVTVDNAELTYKGGPYGQSVIMQPGSTFKVDARWMENYSGTESDQRFLAIAGNGGSKRELEAQARRLKSQYDIDCDTFILGADVTSGETPMVAQTSEVNPARLNASTIADYKVMERLTILAIRFGMLDDYAKKIGELYNEVADIRNENITFAGTIIDSNSPVRHTANHVVDLITSAIAHDTNQSQKSWLQRMLGR